MLPAEICFDKVFLWMFSFSFPLVYQIPFRISNGDFIWPSIMLSMGQRKACIPAYFDEWNVALSEISRMRTEKKSELIFSHFVWQKKGFDLHFDSLLLFFSWRQAFCLSASARSPNTQQSINSAKLNKNMCFFLTELYDVHHKHKKRFLSTI